MDAQASIGSTLRQHREERGLTVEQAAFQCKVPLRLVQALESDDYHLLPDALYLIRLLRDYAVFLKLDAAALETEFLAAIRRPSRASLSVAPAPRPTPTIPWKQVLWTVTAILVITPLVFIALSLASKRSSDQAVQAPVAESRVEETAQGAGESTGRSRPVAGKRPPVRVGGARDGDGAGCPATRGDARGFDDARPDPGPIDVTTEAATGGHVLVATAREPTWLSVRADDQERKAGPPASGAVGAIRRRDALSRHRGERRRCDAVVRRHAGSFAGPLRRGGARPRLASPPAGGVPC